MSDVAHGGTQMKRVCRHKCMDFALHLLGLWSKLFCIITFFLSINWNTGQGL